MQLTKTSISIIGIVSILTILSIQVPIGISNQLTLSASAQNQNRGGALFPIQLNVIQPQFDDVQAFVDGLAPVRVGDKFGYIDRTGKYIWQPSK